MEEFSWSEEVYSIKYLTVHFNFPIVVRVSEGYLSEDGNEAEAFAQGDLIKLDFVKSFQKVAARFLDAESREDEEGYIHPGGDLLIPLGYKGKLIIIHKERQFTKVRELVSQFPRYVRVLKPIQVTQGSHGKRKELPKYSVLELDRVIPGEGLVCRYDSKDVVLNLEQTGNFVSIPDDTKYTLIELIERFQLPQDVKFLDLDFQPTAFEDLDAAIDNIKKFKGCMKLMRVVKQDVVVGHYKPQVDTSQSKSGQFCRRALALLPLDSKVVNEIEVQVPVYSEAENYEFLVAKNFSESVNLEEIDGSLYLEFSNVPRIHRFEKEFPTYEDASPPPRPPKPTHPGSGTRAVRKPPATKRRRDPPPPPASEELKDDDDDDYEEITDSSKQPPKGKKLPPKPTAVTKPTVHQPIPPKAVHVQKKGVSLEKAGLDVTKIPATFKHGLKTVHRELIKRFSRSTPDQHRKHEDPHKELSKADKKESDSDDDESTNYDYPDISDMKRYEDWQLKFERSETEKSKKSPTPSQKFGPQHKSKPVAAVLPMSPSRQNSNVKPFHTMSVEEVVECFRECSLESLAAKCLNENIDGSFMSDIQDKDLKALFGLSELQVKKVGMIKEGWRPKRDG